MSNVILTMYPKYTRDIFAGFQNADFRRSVSACILEPGPHTLYLYETKKGNGSGMVVGEAKVSDILVTLYMQERDKCFAPVQMNSEKLQNIYRQSLLNDTAGYWFQNAKFMEALKQNWPMRDQMFGYYNYTLRFSSVKKYDIPLNISAFRYKNGKPIEKPPRNMCECMHKSFTKKA